MSHHLHASSLRILVFGATGGTGKLFVAQALRRGCRVTAVVRDSGSFNLIHPLLKVIKGDVLQPDSFENDVGEQDVVVSCLGTRTTGPTTVYSQGIANICQVMQNREVKRIISLSAAAVIIPEKASFFMKLVIKYVLHRLFKNLYADMLLMEKSLSRTNLNWTIVRPPKLIDTRFTGKYRSSIGVSLANPSRISRADLADYMLNHLNDKDTFRKIVEVSY